MKLLIPNQSIVFQSRTGLHQVDVTHPNFDDIVELVFNDYYDEAAELVSVRDSVVDAITGTGLELDWDDRLMLDNEEIEGTLAVRMLDMMDEGFSVDPLVKFVRNLRQNISQTSVNELYEFLESSRLPITDDGYFLAYKKVTEDFKDKHTRSMDKSVGSTVSMPRRKVNDNRDQTCSTGLHFAAYNYANSFGSGKLVVLKINPKDVVSIPSDYNNEKGRCCEYIVHSHVESEDTLTGKGFVSSY